MTASNIPADGSDAPRPPKPARTGDAHRLRRTRWLLFFAAAFLITLIGLGISLAL